jgi:P27 family predicted phage terminase small subunit
LRGRPPLPTHLKLVRGNPGKRALKNEPQPAIPAKQPRPPDFLTGYAADEWWRIVGELYRLQLVTAIDINPLAAYCVAYQRWRTAEETLAEMAKRDLQTGALLIKDVTGNPQPNPLVRIAARAAADMLRYAGEFGLTPVARSRLAGGPFGDPPGSGGRFDGLLGDG